MKILLAVDGSSASEKAIDLVATTAWPDGSHVRLIHVAEPNLAAYAGLPGVIVTSEAVDAAIQADREHREELVAAARARLDALGRALDSVIVEGRAASSIVDAAGEFEADLIVLGSHGRGALGSAVLGSVAAEVVEYAATPVLVVRTATLSRLVFADDGSSSAAAARALLGHMPGFRGLPVRVVSVAERQPGWFGWLQPEAAGEIQAFEEALQGDFKAHESIVSTTTDQLVAAGLVAEGVAPVGDPGAEIVRAAEAFHADLIVMGTRGKTGFERLLLGSVAHKVLQRAHCSVLFVRSR